MKGKAFVASSTYDGDICLICKRVIRSGDRVQFHMGPFVMHEQCIENLSKPIPPEGL